MKYFELMQSAVDCFREHDIPEPEADAVEVAPLPKIEFV